MADDDEFEPRLGRMRAGGGRTPKFLNRVLAAANLARGGAARTRRRGGPGGGRLGRGAGVGRVLASRDRFAAWRDRRVVIKTRIVRLAGKGAAAARAHLRYVQRDSVTRDGQPGRLYDAAGDEADAKAFHLRGTGDRHQFRMIVSSEDGAEYDDLKPLTRRLMARVEEDLGTRLDWVAADHFDTGHPHSHIIVRGKDDRGRDLVIARDYLTRGMRERAAELVAIDLGPRSDVAIEARLRAEIGHERLTSLDRALLRDADADGLVETTGRSAFQQTLRMGRLDKLAALGLAEPAGDGRWRLAPELEETLRAMGERGDIIRTMQRAMAARGQSAPLAEQAIYRPAAPDARPLVGRVVARGLSDELDDRHYLVVAATDGRSHYVEIGRGENGEGIGVGMIVEVAPVATGAREADRTVAAAAAANGGRYDVEAHLRLDASATEAFAQAHVRRLEAMRRLTGAVERQPDGSWIVADDHVARAAAFEAARASDRPVSLAILSARPLDRLVAAEAATWLDRSLVADVAQPLREAGFGREVDEALARRRQWLIANGFAIEVAGGVEYPAGMLGALQRRELARVGAQLSGELGLAFVETHDGERVAGTYRRAVDLAGGRFALIEKSKEFTLVPWRPMLERQLGRSVAGIVRGEAISWTFGRERGPSIS